MTFFCIIPARSGSKRLPNKNWLEVGGKTLVQRAVDCALGAGLVPHIVTDAPEKCAIPGAMVWKEPDELAGDDVQMADVIKWMFALDHWVASDYRGQTFVLLQPTAPLRTSADVVACMSIFARSGCDSVISVRRKRVPPSSHMSYEHNGCVYVSRDPHIMGWTQFYVMPSERSVDIDTMDDLEEARRLAGA